MRHTLLFALLLTPLAALHAAEPLRLAVFRVNVTPPVRAPLCGGLVKPTETPSSRPPATAMADPATSRWSVRSSKAATNPPGPSLHPSRRR